MTYDSRIKILSSPRWLSIKIDGIVQGVGFRPAVYRAAQRLAIEGTAENAVDGVRLTVFTNDRGVRRLIEQIKEELPPVARIDTVTISPASDPHIKGFEIIRSDPGSASPTDISPDIAICNDCLEDMRKQPRRIGYPLTNCTNCGPRFTIIHSLPYDRPSTTMTEFEMCPDCRKEYTNPLNRRFHAQPIACNNCGPSYSMKRFADSPRITLYEDILKSAATILRRGGIIMNKSLGGYNLMADATNKRAVEKLRKLKNRPRKPFAIMVKDYDTATRIARISPLEARILRSWRAPIVILPKKEETILPDNLTPGCKTIGILLPYMGFQHDLLQIVGCPLVVTSANRHGSPIIIDDAEASDYAHELSVPLITFNRKIVNRVDDSVVRVCGDGERILRRSRGYVPEGLRMAEEVDGIIGLGADVTSQWAFGRRNDIITSQYIGSLTEEGGERFLRESFQSLSSLYRLKPRLIVTDAHPGYRSSAIGRELAKAFSVPVVNVYHHHAHAVSVMAEFGIDEKLMALILDGTGYGPDGAIWGSELLLCDRKDFSRLDHGIGLPMPGGDIAAKEPWRMGVALVRTTVGDENLLRLLPSPMVATVGAAKIRFLSNMIEHRINSPLSYGAGRLWDAIASLLGLAYFNGYEAEAPILLENAALKASGTLPAYSIDPKEMVEAILADIRANRPVEEIAHAFHRTYSDYWLTKIQSHLDSTDSDKIILSGGVIQNHLLTLLLQKGLEAMGLKVFIPTKVHCGDGGIAVGQIACARARLS